MDTDWTIGSCSWLWEDEDPSSNNTCSGSEWTWEEDKAFENAVAVHHNDDDLWEKIALAVPGKTIEDIKLHYEALQEDVEAIESGKIPLPCYTDDSVSVQNKRKKKIPTKSGAKRGKPWTEEEHRRFLYGLQKYGKGDWKSISRYCVVTKSNSQVASHAQKHFKRLNSPSNRKAKKSKGLTMGAFPASTLAQVNPATSNNPECAKEVSTNDCNAPPPPAPFGGTTFGNQMSVDAGTSTPPIIMSDLPFGNQMSVDAGTSTPPIIMSDLPFAIEPVREPEIASNVTTSTPDLMDLDVFVLPHFLDID